MHYTYYIKRLEFIADGGFTKLQGISGLSNGMARMLLRSWRKQGREGEGGGQPSGAKWDAQSNAGPR